MWLIFTMENDFTTWWKHAFLFLQGQFLWRALCLCVFINVLFIFSNHRLSEKAGWATEFNVQKMDPKIKAEWVWGSKNTEPESSINYNGDSYYPIRTEPSKNPNNSLDQSNRETHDSQWTLEAENQSNRQFEAYLQSNQLPTTKRNQNFSKSIPLLLLYLEFHHRLLRC